MKYWCKSCCQEVAEDDVRVEQHTEIHSEVDTRTHEIFTELKCPICGHELVEADKCICGDWKDPDRDYCDRCESLVRSAFASSVETVSILLHITQYMAQEMILDIMVNGNGKEK